MVMSKLPACTCWCHGTLSTGTLCHRPQIVFSGDFLQLPPVREEPRAGRPLSKYDRPSACHECWCAGHGAVIHFLSMSVAASVLMLRKLGVNLNINALVQHTPPGAPGDAHRQPRLLLRGGRVAAAQPQVALFVEGVS